jgi:hypothetical protein
MVSSTFIHPHKVYVIYQIDIMCWHFIRNCITVSVMPLMLTARSDRDRKG